MTMVPKRAEDSKFMRSLDGKHVWTFGLEMCKCGAVIRDLYEWDLHTLVKLSNSDLGIRPLVDVSAVGELWPAPVEPPKDQFPTTGPFCPPSESTEGRKNDTGKLRYDLIPPGPLSKLAEVYTIGAGKYSDRNWEKGITWGRIFGAMMRHAWAFWRGERNDPVDGQHHLASVAWCAFALMEYEVTHVELDDRGKL